VLYSLILPVPPVVTLPISDPVLIFALAMLIFVAAPLLFERIRVPGLIGLIVAGAVIGPNGLNLLERGATIVLLGTVGLLYLMFMVGLELDLHDFNRYRNRSLVFGSLSFVIPQVAGTLVGRAFGYDIYSSLLLGAVFASHTVLAYPIASRLGIVKNLAVTTTLGGTILTEILALLVLAVVAGGAEGGISWSFWLTLLVSLGIYVVVVLLGVPVLARWFFRSVRSDATLEFVFVMAVLFAVAYAAHAAHVEPIIGALLAGLALNRLIPESGPLMNRIQFVGNALFIPFFLLSVGMLVDVRALSTAEAWIFAGGLALGVIVSKWMASKLTERVFGYTREEGWVVFGLSVPHASGTLAIVLVGFGIGLFDQTEVNGVVLTILLSSLIGPWLVERYGRRVALAEEQKPYEPREAPQRILIPIANPATEESLLDLAMLLRGPESEEPLYPLTVARDSQDRTEAQVAEAERMLSHAVIYAAGAEVPVVPLTRVDQNVAAGIARGIAETRSSTVVVGWDGGRATASSGIFGGVLDQLLDQTHQMVVVAKLGHPLNTTKRLVLVMPPVIHRHPGFFEAARATKVIANRLGATVLGLAVDARAERFAELYAPLKPPVNATWERVGSWGMLLSELRKRVRPDDLVVALSARRGTLPWHPKLERIPAQLAGLVPESFLILYPSEADTSRRDAVSSSKLPRGLMPERMVFDLPSMPFEEALRQLLGSAPTLGSRQLEEITRVLVQGEREFSTEVRPGVVVPHARVAGIQEPILFMGTSPAGIEFPQAREPARLIFILLSPVDRPQEHLRSLAEIARLVGREEKVQELLNGQVAEDEASADAGVTR
jgi:Kef-type K+ transport system membrane component KefB/mannitol/fructose-specific phosphotransferase system IIA component (Ntr-type)